MPEQSFMVGSDVRAPPVTVAEVVESLADPFALLKAERDPAGQLIELRFVAVNAAACTAYGLSRTALVGSGYLEHTPEHGSEGMFARLVRVVETGEPLILDDHLHPSGRSDVPAARLEVRATRVGDGLALTWRDVTERWVERGIREAAERRYRLIAEHSTDFVVEVAPEGRIVWASPSVTAMTGWQPEELVGRRPMDLGPPEAAATAGAFIGRAMAGQATSSRIRFRRRDDTYRWMFLAIQPIIAPDGSLETIVAGFHDIQAEVEAEEALAEREAHYRLLAENATDVVFLSDAGRTLRWVSPSVTEVLGWLPEELVERPGILTLHPEDIAAVDAAVERIAAGHQEALEARYRHKDGTYRWMAISARPVLDPEGRVVARTGSLRDVTAEHEARAALRESEERFRLLAENAVDIVFRSGRGGIVEWISPSIEATMGWRPDQIIGRTVADLVHPDDLAAVKRASDALDAGGESAFDARYRGADGTYRWLAVVARPVRDEAGDVVGRTGSLRDVTALHEAQARIERFNATLEARVRERTEELETFTYTLSHDLRAPLRWIDGFAALLARDEGEALGESGRHHLAAIREATQRMGRLSDALLDWARLGRHAVVRQPLDWPGLLASVRPDIDLGDPAWLAPAAGDPVLVRRILVELVTNALAHAIPGRDPEVCVTATPCERGVVVAVTDRGAGIPPDQLDRIFDPFVRLGPEDPAAGTGIGLAIARRAARMMGTEIEVRSTPGEGSTFSFVLPTRG